MRGIHNACRVIYSPRARAYENKICTSFPNFTFTFVCFCANARQTYVFVQIIYAKYFERSKSCRPRAARIQDVACLREKQFSSCSYLRVENKYRFILTLHFSGDRKSFGKEDFSFFKMRFFCLIRNFYLEKLFVITL